MAFNPSPKVAAAREIGKRFDKPIVIVLMIDEEDGSVEYASYGETKSLCDKAAKVAYVAYSTVMDYYMTEISA